MNIWLITVGEPLPLPTWKDRPWRTGLLAQALTQRGHDVVWWTSTVDHFTKTYFTEKEDRIQTPVGEIRFLHGPLYTKNISLARLKNHAVIAKRFRYLAARTLQRPDVIVCSFPTIELSMEAVRYGTRGVPVILDIRDLWPDLFLDVLPKSLRWAGKLALAGMLRDTRKALAGAHGLIGVSNGYLQWGLDRAQRDPRLGDAVFPLAYQPSSWTAQDARAMARYVLDPFVIFAGTFGRSADLAPVIRAAPLIREIRFILCGGGEKADKWKAMAADVPNVMFTGWLRAGELAYLLSQASVGIAAYAADASQGIPNKVIEYMSAGLPVACSLPGEAKSMLEETGCGMYYRAGDGLDLVRALRLLLKTKADVKAIFDARYSAETVYPAMADYVESTARQPTADVARSTVSVPAC